MVKNKPRHLNTIGISGAIISFIGIFLIFWYNDSSFVCVTQRNIESVAWFGVCIVSFYIGVLWGLDNVKK